MNTNTLINGIKIVRVKKIVNEFGRVGGAELRNFRHAQMSLKERGVMRIWYDENGLMTSDHGAVYALPGRAYVTQAQIDRKYLENN